MIIETNKNEIIIRISNRVKKKSIQNFIDFLNYKEIVSKSKAKQKDIDDLVKSIKKERKNK